METFEDGIHARIPFKIFRLFHWIQSIPLGGSGGSMRGSTVLDKCEDSILISFHWIFVNFVFYNVITWIIFLFREIATIQ